MFCIAKTATNTKRKRRRPPSLRCLRSSVQRGSDKIRSVHVLGPSSIHSLTRKQQLLDFSTDDATFR